MSSAFSKQTDIIRRGITYSHSRHSMIPAVKVPLKRISIDSYWCPFLISQINIRSQHNVFIPISLSGIHFLCQIRKLRRRADLIGIIFLTGSPGKPTCNRTVPHICLRSCAHRHGDPHQCRQGQQGQSHLHAPCFCTFLHNPHAFLYPAKFQIFPNPLQM